MRKPKKPLKPTVKEQLAVSRELCEQLRLDINRLVRERDEARRAAQARVDQTMLAERQRLANSLGQMIEATSKAIMFIVAKEAV